MKSIKNYFKARKSVIQCKTQEEANLIGKMLEELGEQDLSYHFNSYPDDFCLDLSGNQYCEAKYYKREKYTIYQASEFLETNYEIY